jgi:hypothetical protein
VAVKAAVEGRDDDAGRLEGLHEPLPRRRLEGVAQGPGRAEKALGQEGGVDEGLALAGEVQEVGGRRVHRHGERAAGESGVFRP